MPICPSFELPMPLFIIMRLVDTFGQTTRLDSIEGAWSTGPRFLNDTYFARSDMIESIFNRIHFDMTYGSW